MPRSFGTTNAQRWATAPAVGVAGDLYFNTASNTLWISNGTAWVQVGGGGGGAPTGPAGGDLAGTYPNPTIALGAVQTNRLMDGAVTAQKIAQGAVGDWQLADALIQTRHLLDGAVTAPKIAQNAVGDWQLQQWPVQELTSTATTSIAGGTWTTVTGWTGNQPYTSGITAGAFTWLINGMYLVNASVGFATSAATGVRRAIRLVKNGTEVRRLDIAAMAGTGTPSVVQVSHMLPMVSGDTLAVQVLQATGAALALDPTATLPHAVQFFRLNSLTSVGTGTP